MSRAETKLETLKELEKLHKNLLSGIRIRLMDYERQADNLLRIYENLDAGND